VKEPIDRLADIDGPSDSDLEDVERDDDDDGGAPEQEKESMVMIEDPRREVRVPAIFMRGRDVVMRFDRDDCGRARLVIGYESDARFMTVLAVVTNPTTLARLAVMASDASGRDMPGPEPGVQQTPGPVMQSTRRGRPQKAARKRKPLSPEAKARISEGVRKAYERKQKEATA